jgi:hypothetical protein
MRCKIALVFILGILVSTSSAKRVGVLDGLLKPSIIDIHKDLLYIMDTEKVRVYSLMDLKLINSFGKKGEGPGEYKIIVQIPLRLQAHQDLLLVESYDKLLYFTLDGKYLREMRKPFILGMFTQIGTNLIARRVLQPQDGTPSISSVKIYNQNLEEVKELYRQPFIQQGVGLNLKIDLSQDFLLYSVYDNKIFVDESRKGFVIEVFDFTGKKLYEINNPYDKIPITNTVKARLIKDVEMDPHIQRQMKLFGATWKELSKNFQFIFPDHYPPIRTMNIDNHRIYVKTFKKKADKEEYIIMDLKGKVLKKAFVPQTAKPWIMSMLMGIRLETIYNGKVYYVQENEDEEWELLVQAI